MKCLKDILFIMIVVILSSCSVSYSNTNMENCVIKKVIKLTAKNNDLYYMQVRFSHCDSIELRKRLIKEELLNKFPKIGNRAVNIEEYLGKMYNEYKYEIKVE